jgi:hypothetical protein
MEIIQLFVHKQMSWVMNDVKLSWDVLRSHSDLSWRWKMKTENGEKSESNFMKTQHTLDCQHFMSLIAMTTTTKTL